MNPSPDTTPALLIQIEERCRIAVHYALAMQQDAETYQSHHGADAV